MILLLKSNRLTNRLLHTSICGHHQSDISEINFLSSAVLGDIVEIGIEVVSFGTSSITLNSEVRNKMTHETIIIVDNIIIVNLDEDGKPHPHGKKEIEFVKDRLSRANS